jgi:hypothetical protein
MKDAVVAAIRRWESEPTSVDKAAVPVCMTVTVNINLQQVSTCHHANRPLAVGPLGSASTRALASPSCRT